MNFISKKSLAPLLSVLFFTGLFFIPTSSASAQTWCAKAPNGISHVFSSGPACSQTKKYEWGPCAVCDVWCTLDANKKPVNVFQVEANAKAYSELAWLVGGSYRKCTSADITAINNKLMGYYARPRAQKQPSGFIFSLDLAGIVLSFMQGSGDQSSTYSYTTLTYLDEQSAKDPNADPFPKTPDSKTPDSKTPDSKTPDSEPLVRKGGVWFPGDPIVPCGSSMGTNNTSDYGPTNECHFPDFVKLVENVITFLLYISVPIGAMSFSLAGFMYLTAGGNPGKIEEAHGIFKSVAIGILIMLVAWIVVHTIFVEFVDPSFNQFIK